MRRQLVFAGNLPAWLLVPFLLLVGAALAVLLEIVVFRASAMQPRHHDDCVFRPWLHHQVFPAHALFEQARIHRLVAHAGPAV